MKLYGTPASRTRRCMWALEELGVPYELHDVSPRKGDTRTASYLAMNPGAKVPVLVDGDLTLSESAAICNYLGEKYPSSHLTPLSGTSDRARYDQWMYFTVTELEQPLWNIGKHSFALPPDRRVPSMIDVARYEWTVAADVLARGLEGRTHIACDHFTMADIFVAHTLFWARGFDVPLGHAVLDAYADVMLARPAFQRTFTVKPR